MVSPGAGRRDLCRRGSARPRGTSIVEVKRALLPTAVLFIAVSTGCTTTTTGAAVKQPPSIVAPSLPTPTELGKVLHLPMQTDGPLHIGGMESFRDTTESTSPRECAGVAHAGSLRTYHDAPVRDVASRLWTDRRGSDGGVSVGISVVELDSSSSAQSLYASSAGHWRNCRDVTMTEKIGKLSFIEKVRNTIDSKKILATEITLSTDDKLMSPGVNWRAFTATSRYVVDVEVVRISRHPDVVGIDPAAVARLVVAKIAELS
jgi:hypothetical protein